MDKARKSSKKGSANAKPQHTTGASLNEEFGSELSPNKFDKNNNSKNNNKRNSSSNSSNNNKNNNSNR